MDSKIFCSERNMKKKTKKISRFPVSMFINVGSKALKNNYLVVTKQQRPFHRPLPLSAASSKCAHDLKGDFWGSFRFSPDVLSWFFAGSRMCLRPLCCWHLLGHRSLTPVSHSSTAWLNVSHVWDHAFHTCKFSFKCHQNFIACCVWWHRLSNVAFKRSHDPEVKVLHKCPKLSKCFLSEILRACLLLGAKRAELESWVSVEETVTIFSCWHFYLVPLSQQKGPSIYILNSLRLVLRIWTESTHTKRKKKTFPVFFSGNLVFQKIKPN